MKITHQLLQTLIFRQTGAIRRYLKRIDDRMMKPCNVLIAILVHDPDGSMFLPLLLPGESEVHTVGPVTFTIGLASRQHVQALLKEHDYTSQAEALGYDDCMVFAVGFESFAAAGVGN